MTTAPSRASFTGRALPSKRPVRLLFLSNGQGEDAIGAMIAAALDAEAAFPVSMDAWAMVGRGEAYVTQGLGLTGSGNTLPSEGFGTLSARAFVRDLRAGWLRVHWTQLRSAIALRGHYDFCVAVGDIVPLAAAWLTRTPFVLVGCAKSAYYGKGSGYTRFERWLLHRAIACYARDERTVQALAEERIAARFLGNPMMDGLGSGAAPPRSGRAGPVVACLPGSRADQERNAARILAFISAAGGPLESANIRRFDFALARGFNLDAFHGELASLPGGRAWRPVPSPPDEAAEVLRLRHGGFCATFAFDALGDVLSRARVAIGLAGTANEQAIGAGVPVVTFATEGVQGDAYLRMKMPYFGDSAVRVPANAAAIAEALVRITSDTQLHRRMAAAGRERMGVPGATRAIARDILAHCG